MRERREILELWGKLAASGQGGVLATVLRTRGSSYRMPGARLLIGPAGEHAGGVSGGCLEEDIFNKAWWLTADGPVLRRYDTTPDGELASDGYGLGCNGVIDVLLERVTAEKPSILPILSEVNQSRTPVTILHHLSAESVGQFERCAPGADCCNRSSEDVFVEQFVPPTRLLVFGAGDDAIPLTQLAHQMGWVVWVFDGRAHYARRQKFPLADRVETRLPQAPPPALDPWTVAVTMTHSYSQDLDVLRTFSNAPPRYLGLLGPRKRTEQLMADLGLHIDFASSLFAPMGLDLGGHGPEQVALAVVAEIQSVLHERSGERLRELDRPIHSRNGSSGAPEEAWVRSVVCA